MVEFKDIKLKIPKPFDWKKHGKVALLFVTVIMLLLATGTPIKDFFGIFIFLFAWFIYVYLRYFKKQDNITDRLCYFITANHLMEIKENVVTNYARFAYLEDEKLLTVRAYKFADIFSKKANEYDEQLQALFGLALDNKIDDIRYCDYIFKKNSDKRLVVGTKEEKEHNNSTIIPLNNNLTWNILKQPHALIAGVTGGGKTTFIFYLLLELLKMKSILYICDPKKSDLGSLKHILGDEFVATEPNHISRVIRQAKEEMDNRYKTYKDNPNNFKFGASFVDYKLSPIVVIFDEMGAFRAGADKKVYAETMSNLTEIILKGREMGVFVILSTQQPNSNNIPTELRDNLSMRIALGNMGNEGYRMVFGESNNNIQSISTVGSAYIYLDGLGWNSPKQFQSPYVDYNNFDFIAEIKKYRNTEV